MDPTEKLIREQVWAAMYRGASIALNFSPGEETLDELACLTKTSVEAVRACGAMRDAPEHKRVFAALDYLRAQRAADAPATAKAPTS